MASQDASLDEHIPKDLDGVVWMLAYVVSGMADAVAHSGMAVEPALAQGLAAASTILSRTASGLNHPEIAKRFAAAGAGFSR
jgi:hypothetical protein